MQCKFHPQKEARNFCAMCGHPLCDECSQAIMLGEYYCYSCSLSITKPPPVEKKPWIPAKYVIIIIVLLVVIMMLSVYIR